jgi:hypothetical protein
MADALVGAISETLRSVRSNGRVPHSVAARLRSVARDEQSRDAGRPAPELVEALPAFDTLPTATQRSLYDVVLRDDSWSMWLRRQGWRQGLTRWTRTIAAKVPKSYARVQRLLDLTELTFIVWHARLVHELYRRGIAWRGWNAAEPTLASALKVAGLDARAIAASYLRRTPQVPETAAYWHDPAHHNTVGVVIGIDFIVNDHGVWFVESNLNAGLTEERSELYESDPFVTNLVSFAKNNGYGSVVYVGCNDYPVDHIMARRIEEEAHANGLRATILEDRHAPKGRLPQTFLVPPFENDRTLIVRSKLFHTTLDAFFHNKTVTQISLESYLRTFDDADIQLPPNGEELFSKPLSMEGPFPNLVYKFPERDQGQGVVFLRVPSVARAQEILADTVTMNRNSVADIWTKLRYSLNLEDQTGVFQAYIPSFLLDGRRLSIARAHVLATPVGMTFLSAHRVVSNIPVPEVLPEGLVENARPYIVNYSLDSEHASIPADEERRVMKAAMGVVRALCWGVEGRFQTRPS